MPESQGCSKHKPTPLYWMGLVLFACGATLTANLIIGQFRKSTPLMHRGDNVYINGQYAGTVAQDEMRDDDEQSKHYWLIGGSALIAVVGVVIMVLARRLARAQSAETAAAADGGRDPGSS